MSNDAQGATAPAATTGDDPTRGRWWLVAAALLLQFSIGAVYAWSVFMKALQEAPAFELGKLEASPAVPGDHRHDLHRYLHRRPYPGPERPSHCGLGRGRHLRPRYPACVVRRQRRDELWLLVTGYGVIGGFGLGLACIMPIAMLQKWFPDKRGLITGLAVGGFGFGAVLTSPVAQQLIEANSDVPVRSCGWASPTLAMSLIGASFFRDPPRGTSFPATSRPRPAGSWTVARTTPRARPCVRRSGTCSLRS